MASVHGFRPLVVALVRLCRPRSSFVWNVHGTDPGARIAGRCAPGMAREGERSSLGATPFASCTRFPGALDCFFRCRLSPRGILELEMRIDDASDESLLVQLALPVTSSSMGQSWTVQVVVQPKAEAFEPNTAARCALRFRSHTLRVELP